MQERYEVARSAKYVQGNAAVRVHVICREERFYQDVPQEIRWLGPWSVSAGATLASCSPNTATHSQDRAMW